MNILVLGVFSGIQKELKNTLDSLGFTVTQAKSRADLEHLSPPHRFDLVLLEQDPNTNEVSAFLDQWLPTKNTPQTVLLSSSEKDALGPRQLRIERLLSPDFSASDLDPFLGHLENQLLKRSTIEIAKLSIHRLERSVSFEDTTIQLTELEFDLLWLLAENQGRVLSTTRILSQIWGLQHDPQSNRVAVFMKRLREKLPDKNLIHNVRGVGYVLDPGRSD